MAPLSADSWIIVVNWNGAHLLGACLGSLSRLTRPAHVAVVDNGSSDDSSRVVASFPDVEWIPLGRNTGFAAANNVGLRLALAAGARWVAIANTDVQLEPDWLERLVEAGEAHPEAGILGGLLLFERDPARVHSTGLTLPARGGAGRRRERGRGAVPGRGAAASGAVRPSVLRLLRGRGPVAPGGGARHPVLVRLVGASAARVWTELRGGLSREALLVGSQPHARHGHASPPGPGRRARAPPRRVSGRGEGASGACAGQARSRQGSPPRRRRGRARGPGGASPADGRTCPLAARRRAGVGGPGRGRVQVAVAPGGRVSQCTGPPARCRFRPQAEGRLSP